MWSVLGGVASVTKRLSVGTGVTCPILRTHPAIVAQATATVAAMIPAIRKATRAGYDHVCLHQVGPEQEGFIRFFEREIRPRLRRAGAAPRRVPAPRRRAA